MKKTVAEKFDISKAAGGFASVCIPVLLFWFCITGYHKTAQSQAMIFLSSLVVIPSGQVTAAAEADSKNISAAGVGQQAVLNADIKDEHSGWRTVRMRVTAYCPCKECCGRFAKGQTASGYVIRQGSRFAAADKKYPFGTEIIVPRYNGDKPIRVIDRGGAIKGDRLDVFFHRHWQARKWGVKYLDVKIKVQLPN